MKVGITGQTGFIGNHLYNYLGLYPEKFERIHFKKEYFNNIDLLSNFVKKCDVIVHLAAMNRHSDEKELYKTNVSLVKNLITVLENENIKPHIIFASSIQENQNNYYGKSKLKGRKLFEEWAKRKNAFFTGIVIPNVFGPFCLQNYNSVIATFCHRLTHDDTPEIMKDINIDFIYVLSLCKKIISEIDTSLLQSAKLIKKIDILPDFSAKVSDILGKLKSFRQDYLEQGVIPKMSNSNEVNLFNTFISYIDLDRYFPKKLKQNIDMRGVFVEMVKENTGGQVSFSITKSKVTRGNHYHTHKIERFIVIKGSARIQLRKIGSEKIFEYFLNGNEPSYVDIPIWYTHNITNVGSDNLYTVFWVNEIFDNDNVDQYYEQVQIMSEHKKEYINYSPPPPEFDVIVSIVLLKLPTLRRFK